ncbi:PIN domain-containing protein [Agathobacter sp.]|uniref:PIN domain-containing protein n=1 Tax=Agathobacter sp. TaxID=2021311 RepID=UPI003FD88E45
MVIIIRHFLVDSENVNDNWLMLFDMADEDDEIVVFYTKKSPHMSYMSVIRLMENNSINVRFEECYEGTNALDFQLVSYMGYLMGRNDTHSESTCEPESGNTEIQDNTKPYNNNSSDTPIVANTVDVSAASCADEYIIMSNDTGYDPAVRFWKDKGHAVRRFNVNFCKQAVQRRKNIKYQVVADIPSKEDTANINTDNDAITAKSYNLNELIDGNHSGYTDSEPLSDELATNDDLPSIDKLMTNDDLPFTDEQTPNDSSNNGLPFKGAVSSVLKSEKTAYSNKNEAAEAKASMDSIDTSDISEVSAVSDDFNHFEVDSFLNCMGKDNLLMLHETLVHVYGMKQGQTIYKTIKDKSYSFTPEKLTRKKKVERFTGIIFAHSDINDPGNFVDFLEKNKNKTKNLNGIRSAITKSYGETDGMKYYSLFKPYFKIISALK